MRQLPRCDAQTSMTLQDFIDLAAKVGFSGLLTAIIYGSYKRVWVWGSELESTRKEAEAWKELALRNSGIANRTLTMAEEKRP